MTTRTTERCSFCEKTRPTVECLIAGPPRIYICNECVDLCVGIITEELGRKPPASCDAESTGIGVTVTAHTLTVTVVAPGSPAAHAGLEPGDVLEHDPAHVRFAVTNAVDGRVLLNVRRDGKVKTVVVHLEPREPGRTVDL